MKRSIQKLALLSCCVVCFFISGCQNQEKEISQVSVNDNSENVTNENEMQIEGIGIDTPYGKLVFPEQWYDYLKIEIIDEKNIYQIDFLAEYDTHQFLLFSIIYGETMEGLKLGNFTNRNKEIPVYLKVTELVIPNDFPNELEDSVYAMQEEVNYICEQLYNDVNFEKVKN